MANTQPIAEAVIKVKLDPASLDFVRNQLKGLNIASNISIGGDSGIGVGGVGGISRSGAIMEQALANRLGSGSGGSGGRSGSGDSIGKKYQDAVNRSEKVIQDLAKEYKIDLTGDPDDPNRFKVINKAFEIPKDKARLLGGAVQDDEVDTENIRQKQTNELQKQTKELQKQEGQLRTNLSLAKTHLDTIARTVKYMTAPIVGLGIFGFNKYLQTLDSGAINLRKAIGGLTYSWNQFLARVGDTINKSYGLQKIIQNISRLLDSMDENKIKLLFNVGVALSFLFVVTKISTAVVQIGRMLSTMRTAASSFSLGSLFKGPSAAGGAVGGAVSSAVGGAVSGAANMLKGVSLEGIGTALLKIGKIATTVTALLLVLARVMGVEGKNGTEVLLNTLKIFVNIFKWVADIIITIVKSMASDIMKIVEDFKNIIDGIMNIFITIGDSINFLANLWNELFAGGPADSLEKFKAKLSDVWGNWINQVNSTGFGAKDKDKNKEENKKYVFGGTTTTSSFAGLNRLAQDLADNTMLMAADKMDQAANKMDQAADKINNQWADHGPSNKPLVFNPSFATF